MAGFDKYLASSQDQHTTSTLEDIFVIKFKNNAKLAKDRVAPATNPLLVTQKAVKYVLRMF